MVSHGVAGGEHILSATLWYAMKFERTELPRYDAHQLSSSMLHHLMGASSYCWRKSSGPMKLTFAGQCCKTSSLAICERAFYRLQSFQVDETIFMLEEQLGKLAQRYRLLLLPFINLQLVFHVSKIQGIQSEILLGQQLLPGLLSFFLQNDAVNEVS